MTQSTTSVISLSEAFGANEVHETGSACRDVEHHFARRGHGEEFEMEAQWILRALPPGASQVLDVGCGIGALFAMIGVSRVVGVDCMHAGLRRTRQRCPRVRLACGDGAILPFDDGSFDAVTVQHVIEHLPDAAGACCEWRRVLRPHGRLIIVTPNIGFRDPAIFDDPTHIRLFDRRSLRQTMESGGLNILQLRTMGLPWFRHYHQIPGGWRLRRTLLRKAEPIARIPYLRWAGQSLCCVARRSDH